MKLRRIALTACFSKKTMFLLFFLSWVVCASGQPRPVTPSLNEQYHDVAEYAFSKIVGVFKIVDEDSCSCVLRTHPCPVEILEDSVYKARGFPCPFLTRYCCQRETLVDLSDAINKNRIPVTQGDEDIALKGGNGNLPSTPGASDAKISTENSLKPVPLPSANRPLTDVTKSDTFDVKKITSNTIRPERPKACSCLTRDQCLSWWSELDSPPEVKITTSLRCETPGQITCCFGRIVPPRHQKSRDSEFGVGAQHTFRRRWRPLTDAWERLVSWFNR